MENRKNKDEYYKDKILLSGSNKFSSLIDKALDNKYIQRIKANNSANKSSLCSQIFKKQLSVINIFQKSHNYIDFINSDNKKSNHINNFIKINNLHFIKDNLGSYSSRNRNLKLSMFSNIFNDLDTNSETSHSVMKKKKLDVVKNRFIIGKKNYIKRIYNLEEIGQLDNKDIIDFELNVKHNNLKNYDNIIFRTKNGKKYPIKKYKNENSKLPSIQTKNRPINYNWLKNNILKRKKNFSQNRVNIINLLDSQKEFDETRNQNLNSKQIINDNYNDYLNDISSSNTSEENDNKIRKPIIIKNEPNQQLKSISDNQKYMKISQTNTFKDFRIIPRKIKIQITKTKESEIIKNAVLNNVLRNKLLK